jgi:hypothetical protein
MTLLLLLSFTFSLFTMNSPLASALLLTTDLAACQCFTAG